MTPTDFEKQLTAIYDEAKVKKPNVKVSPKDKWFCQLVLKKDDTIQYKYLPSTNSWFGDDWLSNNIVKELQYKPTR